MNLDDHWFADLSDEEEEVEGAPWQPFLQIAGGCFPLPIWFGTEAECQSFINSIPRGTPDNVESSGCIWCKGRPLPDHDCKNFEQFTENVDGPT